MLVVIVNELKNNTLQVITESNNISVTDKLILLNETDAWTKKSRRCEINIYVGNTKSTVIIITLIIVILIIKHLLNCYKQNIAPLTNYSNDIFIVLLLDVCHGNNWPFVDLQFMKDLLEDHFGYKWLHWLLMAAEVKSVEVAEVVRSLDKEIRWWLVCLSTKKVVKHLWIWLELKREQRKKANKKKSKTKRGHMRAKLVWRSGAT